MEILVFEPLISGTRVNLSHELREEMGKDITFAGHYVTPENVPDFVLYGIWWSIKGMSLELLFIEDSTDVKIRVPRKNDTIILTDYYSKSVYDVLIGSISHDDQIKVWLYRNKPEIWKQLVDHYGSAKKVFDNYVRFNH